MTMNKTHINRHPGAAPFLLPTGIRLNVNIDEATPGRLRSLLPGESIGLAQPYVFAGSPPAVGQSYEITVGSATGDFTLGATIIRVLGDYEVEAVATPLGSDVPSEGQAEWRVMLERLDFDRARPWLMVTMARLHPMQRVGMSKNGGAS